MASLAKTATFMAVLSLASKLFGFIREMVLAGFYGTSEVADIYVLANAIPTYVLGSLFSAVATAYMPLLASNDLRGKAGDFTNKMITILLLLSGVSVLIGILFSDKLVYIFGYRGNSADVAASFCRISFCYVIFSSVSNIQSSYLQYKNVFLPQIIAGYAVSLASIIFIMLSANVSIYLLPFGQLAGYGCIVLVQSLMARTNGYVYKPDFKIRGTLVSIMSLVPMVFIGSAVSYINGFIDKMFATSLPEGSVSSLNYGNLIQNTIFALSISIISTIIYPRLTKAAIKCDTESFNDMVQKGIMMIIIIMAPFTFGIIAFHNEVVQVIYERGAFSTGSTDMTSAAFLYYGSGLVFSSLNTFIIQAYYSMKNMKTSVWCGIVGVTVNIALDFALVGPMRHGGLALATSIANMVNTFTLYYCFARRYPDIKLIKSIKKIISVVIAAGFSVLLAYGVYHGLAAVIWMPRLFYLLIAICAAILCYLPILWKCRIEEIGMLKKIFK